MITSKKVYELVEIFERLPRRFFDYGHLDMWRPDIYSDGSCSKEYSCGTEHCFAGWFLIAKHFSEIRDGKFVSGPFKDKHKVIFTRGIRALHEHFFPDADNSVFYEKDCEYNIFTSFNEDIWGNSHQSGMFKHSDSFTPRNKISAVTLGEIVDHWAEVAMRLQILELYVEGEKWPMCKTLLI